MRNRMERGEIMPAVVMLLAICLIIFVFIVPSHKVGPFAYLSTGSNNSSWSNSNQNIVSNGQTIAKNSAYSTSVSLGSGNASYAYEPYEEYVTIQNNSNEPVDITGWKLQNSRGTRTYSVGSSQQTFASNQVSIPRALPYVPSGGAGLLEDVVLRSGETAIVTTGSVGIKTPYEVTSFKENECSGYLENLRGYDFTPSMSFSCAYPQNEPGTQSLDRDCQNFLSRLSSCHTPEYQTVDQNGNVCNGCVDSNSTLSTSCVAFIKSHFSYQGCLANHLNDPNFSGRQWRIFLNQPWELWATDHETISLFDSKGYLVDYINY